MNKWMWFIGGVVVGLTSLSVSRGSIPNRVTDDTALYQNLRELDVAKERDLNFDADIARLAGLEKYYRTESLDSLRKKRLYGPMKRISKKKYRPSVSKKNAKKRRAARQ